MPKSTDIHSGLTQQRLRSVVHYDPLTGEFRWIAMQSKKAGVLVGEIAGTLHKATGYRKICIGKRIFKASRLAWLYQTGAWPHGDIDHIDCDKANDVWANLRDVTNSQNHANTVRRKTNTSGFKGVHWDSRRNKWRAVITVNYKDIYLGRFASAEEAAAAYWAAATKHFGEFARAS